MSPTISKVSTYSVTSDTLNLFTSIWDGKGERGKMCRGCESEKGKLKKGKRKILIVVKWVYNFILASDVCLCLSVCVCVRRF